MNRIVRALKEFAHPNATQQLFADFNRVIENALTLSSNEWRRIAEVELDLAPNLPPVWCAPGELGQAVVNLIVNAAQAIDERKDRAGKGRITVRTRRSGTFATLSVTDTGVGMPADLVNYIFEPFFTTKPVGKGTGQGLARVQAMTEAHGGQVTCASEVGRGTTFTVVMPFQPAQPSA